MNVENNIAVVHRLWEAFNDHDIDRWDEILTDDFMNHDPGLPVPHADKKTIMDIIGNGMLNAFPDLQTKEEGIVAAGDQVVTRRSFKGTSKGSFMGIPPTGKPVHFTTMHWCKLRDGKICEMWVEFDAMGMLKQLGAIPAPDEKADAV